VWSYIVGVEFDGLLVFRFRRRVVPIVSEPDVGEGGVRPGQSVVERERLLRGLFRVREGFAGGEVVPQAERVVGVRLTGVGACVLRVLRNRLLKIVDCFIQVLRVRLVQEVAPAQVKLVGGRVPVSRLTRRSRCCPLNSCASACATRSEMASWTAKMFVN
jgi:hypothetical protein